MVRFRPWIAATLGGKTLAAVFTGRIFGYRRAETPTTASLSLPQMAATLASAVVGHQAMNAQGERLLDAGFANAVVVLVVFTCVLGPVLTERFAHSIRRPPARRTKPLQHFEHKQAETPGIQSFRLLLE